jgi:hypothetical protein
LREEGVATNMSLKQDLAMERSRRSVRYFYEWLGYTWGEHIEEWMDMYSERKGAEVHRVCLMLMWSITPNLTVHEK